MESIGKALAAECGNSRAAIGGCSTNHLKSLNQRFTDAEGTSSKSPDARSSGLDRHQPTAAGRSHSSRTASRTRCAERRGRVDAVAVDARQWRMKASLFQRFERAVEAAHQDAAIAERVGVLAEFEQALRRREALAQLRQQRLEGAFSLRRQVLAVSKASGKGPLSTTARACTEPAAASARATATVVLGEEALGVAGQRTPSSASQAVRWSSSEPCGQVE